MCDRQDKVGAPICLSGSPTAHNSSLSIRKLDLSTTTDAFPPVMLYGSTGITVGNECLIGFHA
jgi:hypothetical protein